MGLRLGEPLRVGGDLFDITGTLRRSLLVGAFAAFGGVWAAIGAGLLVLAMGLDIVDAGWVAVYAAAVLVVLAIDAFRRLEVRDGFLVWVGGSFGAIYPALLAFMAGILVAAPDVPSDAFLGDLSATRFLVGALAVFGVITVIGHFVAIVSSSKLRS